MTSPIRPDGLAIRPLAGPDRAGWDALWRAYLAFYDTVLPAAVHDHHFARLTAPVGDFRALVAERDGQLLGLVHYLFHPHGWKTEGTCYLQDLFSAPAARGMGVGRALIEAVYAAADARGVPSVYWMTQTGNATARQLYDRIAAPTDFMVYRRRT
jgi:GNAT superfamily N-acetyltransferase